VRKVGRGNEDSIYLLYSFSNIYHLCHFMLALGGQVWILVNRGKAMSDQAKGGER
jgi:hypothetical protein